MVCPSTGWPAPPRSSVAAAGDGESPDRVLPEGGHQRKIGKGEVPAQRLRWDDRLRRRGGLDRRDNREPGVPLGHASCRGRRVDDRIARGRQGDHFLAEPAGETRRIEDDLDGHGGIGGIGDAQERRAVRPRVVEKDQLIAADFRSDDAREESPHRLDVLRSCGPADLDGTAGVGAGNEASVRSGLQGCTACRLSKVHRHGSDRMVGERDALDVRGGGGRLIEHLRSDPEQEPGHDVPGVVSVGVVEKGGVDLEATVEARRCGRTKGATLVRGENDCVLKRGRENR
jgi:hypothetical protein